jgi:hypothetical protein
MNKLTASVISPRHLGFLVLAAAVPLVAIVVFLGGSDSRGATRRPHTAATSAAHKVAAPDAAGFAARFAGVTNQAAKENGNNARIVSPHCVSPSAGYYMCTYAVARLGAARECHLMQAHWTPGRASSFEVTLAGRTGKCGSIREAVHSLR